MQVSTPLHRNSLGQNKKYSNLYSVSSFRFSQLASAGYCVAILYYCGQSVSQNIDDLPVLANCRVWYFSNPLQWR